MPDLALAAPPASPVASATVASNTTAVADNAGDAAQASPFATLLQEQLAAQILIPPPVFEELPAAELATEAADDTLLPMLMGLGLTSQSATPGSDLQTPAELLAAADASNAEDPQLLIADPSAAVPLALPATVNQAGQQEAQHKVGGPQADLLRSFGESSRDRHAAATSAATATAISAATADSARSSQAGLALGKFDEGVASGASFAADIASARAEALQQLPAPQARSAEQAARIETPLGTRPWDGEFANRVALMVGKNEQRADLTLTPPQLGRIEVSLSVSGDQATAIFTSASATVRDAIENALPRLREVLLESGINLGQTHVGSESPQQQSAGQEKNGDNRASAGNAGQDNRVMPPGFAANSPTAWLRSGRGMIDVFA